MPNPLSPVERRVVGVLLEKVLSTPTAYPLTLNALVAGCNQKNNREPVMELSEGDVLRVLEPLREKRLVAFVRLEGSRADKWRTTAREAYGLATEKDMAVFAELLLRGPATKAELRTRASRMRHEITAEEIDQIIADFCGRADPLAQNLGRAPGGRADRYTHTLWREGERAALQAAVVTHEAPRAAAPALAPAPAASAPASAVPADAELAAKLETALREIEELKERVGALEEEVRSLRYGA